MTIVFIFIISFHIVILGISIYNFLFTPSFLEKEIPQMEPMVSVLIEAGNNEDHIENILNDISIQGWNKHETVVIIDNSNDNTEELIRKHMSHDNRITLIKSKETPENWTRKNWNCHQLSQKANGEYYIFIDPLCRITPWLISSIIAKMEKHNLDLLSSFPRQIMKSIGEHLSTPLMNWLILSFIPIHKIFSFSHKSAAIASCDLIAFNSSSYKTIGGHKDVAHMSVEYMKLAQLYKEKKSSIMTILGGNGISCRKYKSFIEGFKESTKQIYPVYNKSKILFFMLILLGELLFLFSLLLPFFYKPWIAIILIICLQRYIVSLTVKENKIINIILHPFQIITMGFIAFTSMNKHSKE